MSFPDTDKKVLGVSAFVAINMCIIFSVRGFPLLAEEGLSLVFYLLFSALTFLVPTALICAELSSAWPPRGPGGVYIWSREAFGTKWAFLAGGMVIISGIEIAAVHPDAVKNPKRSMPLAILICTVLSCTLLLGFFPPG